MNIQEKLKIHNFHFTETWGETWGGFIFYSESYDKLENFHTQVVAYYHDSSLTIYSDLKRRYLINVCDFCELFNEEDIERINIKDTLNVFTTYPNWKNWKNLQEICVLYNMNCSQHNFDQLFELTQLKYIKMPNQQNIGVDISELELYSAITGCPIEYSEI